MATLFKLVTRDVLDFGDILQLLLNAFDLSVLSVGTFWTMLKLETGDVFDNGVIAQLIPK